MLEIHNRGIIFIQTTDETKKKTFKKNLVLRWLILSEITKINI